MNDQFGGIGGRQVSRRGVLTGMVAGGLLLGAARTGTAYAAPARADGTAESANTIGLGDFETGLDGWTGGVELGNPGAQVEHRFERTDARAHAGTYSASLWGHFVQDGYNAFASRSLGDVIPGQLPHPDIHAISLWVYVDNLTAVLLRMTDATGQIHQQALPVAAEGQWVHLSVTQFAGGQDYLHFHGADDGVWHGPPQTMALLLDHGKLRDDSRAATIWFDEVTGVFTPAPVTLTQTRLGNVFTTRQHVAFDVTSVTGSVAWSVRDVWGNVQRTGVASTDSDQRLVIPADGPGYYQLSVAAEDDPAAAVTTPYTVLTPAPRPHPSDPFGMCTHFHNWGTATMDLMGLSGMAEVRDEVYWSDVEQTKGTYTFPEYAERYLPALRSRQISPLIVLDFENANYDDGNTPYTAEGIAAYGRYCQQVVQHYGDQIRWVEVWNEYNGGFSHGPGAQSVDNYLKLLKAAYQGVKQANSDVTVIGPVTSGVPTGWLEDLFKLGALDYLDAVSVHPYQYPGPPEGLADQMSQLDTLIKKYNGGSSKPMWISEIGWPTDITHNISERTQAQDIVRTYLLSLAAGVEKVFWYDFLNDGTDTSYNENNFGVIRAAADSHGRYTPKPAYPAFATMVRQLSGARYHDEDEGTPDDVHSLVFRRGSSETRTVWTTGDHRDLTLSVPEPVWITDMMGRARRYEPVDGAVYLSVSGEPVYVSGQVRGISDGATLSVSAPTVAAGDDLPVTLSVDATGSAGPLTARFDLVGRSHPVLVLARAGQHAEKTITVPGLDGTGVRTVVADVDVRGRRVARLTADAQVRAPVTIAVAPVVLAADPVQAALKVTVTNNSASQQRTVGPIEWSVGSQSGTSDATHTVAAGASTTVQLAVPGIDAWTPYDGSVTVHVNGIDALSWAGKANFGPVRKRSITVDGALDSGVSGLAAIDLSRDATWTSLIGDQTYGGASDAGGRTWLFWDDDRLYLVASITDDVFSQTQTGGSTWMGDSIQFALVDGPPQSGPVPYRFELALTPEGPQLNRDLAPAGVQLGLVTDASVAITRTGTTTVYEVGIPWAQTPLDATTDVFSFVMLYNDNDGNNRKGFLQWADSLGSGNPNPIQFNACQIVQG